MEFEYFYERQPEKYSFYRIPKRLFTDESFSNLSTEAKVLYGLLLDRVSLSRENGWVDESGRIYVLLQNRNNQGRLAVWQYEGLRAPDGIGTIRVDRKSETGPGKTELDLSEGFFTVPGTGIPEFSKWEF